MNEGSIGELDAEIEREMDEPLRHRLRCSRLSLLAWPRWRSTARSPATSSAGREAEFAALGNKERNSEFRVFCVFFSSLPRKTLAETEPTRLSSNGADWRGGIKCNQIRKCRRQWERRRREMSEGEGDESE